MQTQPLIPDAMESDTFVEIQAASRAPPQVMAEQSDCMSAKPS